MFAENFRGLEVYKQSRKLSNQIFQRTREFPKEEMYSLTDQIRRSSRSVGAQIAEAWGKRRYEKHFISKPTDADGEQMETQHWIEVSLDSKYISKDEATQLLEQCTSIGKMIGSMIAKSSKFCKPSTTAN